MSDLTPEERATLRRVHQERKESKRAAKAVLFVLMLACVFFASQSQWFVLIGLVPGMIGLFYYAFFWKV